MSRDAQEIKQRIMQIFKTHGPSLPVHISTQVGMSILFTSAFLSELFSERQLKISDMRVGTSPIYYISGQEPQLEKYAEHFKGKEKEAFHLLKENKFLQDSKQPPPIRVALRAIKDFAIPIKKDNEIFWKYLTATEEEFEPAEKVEPEPIIISKTKTQDIEESSLLIDKHTGEEKCSLNNKFASEASVTGVRGWEYSEHQKQSEPISKQLNIFDKPKKIIKKKSEKKTPKKSTSSQKIQEKFFNKVKEFLSEKQADILEIISANKSELILKIKIENKEKILVGYNKKKISEKEIIQAHKKSQEFSLPYLIMSLGEMPKKLSELIEALKTLADIEKIE